MLFWLRVIISSFSLALCILFSVLWVRSYFYSDFANRQTAYTILRLTSSRGVIRGEFYGCKSRIYTGTSTVYQFRTRKASHAGGGPTKGFLGILWKPGDKSAWGGNEYIEFSFPPWAFALATGLSAFLVHPKPPMQYSLRDLMLLVTFLGLMLGAITSLINASGLATY
ncbi:hypothetical protein Pla144_06600 [Bythopirellula polymerisocia]|uniref:Uncharacterized protein n=2 Tax=Bythopirellula polymerisocia TaxID=2528003 RepID=A0A5C6CZ59_9BACT|nr:hypothetical protein Pla144_06600 [Bythopirellula polymerisocia]